MFETLTDRLHGIFDSLTRRGALAEADVDTAFCEVRVALLDADVALPVVKDFVTAVRERALGHEVLRSVTPGQMVVKIVHDHLVDMLGRETSELKLNAPAPAVYMLVGLQGSGKTTTTAKIGKHLVEKCGRKVLMASLDVRRPAAQDQLRVLGDQILVPTLDIAADEAPMAISKRAMATARREGYDIILLDTAGRSTVDAQMMDEAAAVRDATLPAETLLVADAMTGQDAVNIARAFHHRVALTGIVLTRVDGDARGGAALSMRAVTGCPIKLLGTGEKLDALEPFHPARVAGRILGMGDVVSLVEKAAETIEHDEAEKLAAKIQRGSFDLEDLAKQLRQLTKMGGFGGIMSMLPGVGKIKKQMQGANIDERMIKRQEAIINSMTPQERRRPQLLKASRKRRVAGGSGSTVQDVNRLLKQHRQMQTMMKRMGKMGGRGLPPGMLPPGRPG